MMKRQVMLEHRAALDAFEAAKNKHVACRRKSGCGDVNECVDCPFFQAKRAAEEVFEEKCEVLEALNKQVINHNDTVVLTARMSRRKERMQRRQQQEQLSKRRIKQISEKEVTYVPANVPAKAVVKKTNLTSKDLTSKDLTKEKLLHHLNVERMTKTAVGEMYNIPRGSLNGLLKRMLAEMDDPVERKQKQVAEVNTHAQAADVELRAKISTLETEYATIVEQQQSVQTAYEELHAQHTQTLNLLSVAQDMNVTRQAMLKSLEGDLKIERNVRKTLEEQLEAAREVIAKQNDISTSEQNHEVIAELEKQVEYERQMRVAVECERDDYRTLAHDTAAKFDSYKQEVTKLIAERDEDDEETIEKINSQLHKTDTLIELLMDYSLQLKKRTR